MNILKRFIFVLIFLIGIQSVLADERDYYSDAERAMKELRYSDALELYRAAIVFQNKDATDKVEECRKQLQFKRVRNQDQIEASDKGDNNIDSLSNDNLSLMAEEIDDVYNGNKELSRPCLYRHYDNRGVDVYFPKGCINLDGVCQAELLSIIDSFSGNRMISLDLMGLPSRTGTTNDERGQIGQERLNNIIYFLKSKGFIDSQLTKMLNDKTVLSETACPVSIDGVICVNFTLDEASGYKKNGNTYISEVKIPLYKKTIDIDFLRPETGDLDTIIAAVKQCENFNNKTYCIEIRQNHSLTITDEIRNKWRSLWYKYAQGIIVAGVPEINVKLKNIGDHLSDNVLADIIIYERPDIKTINVNNIPIYMYSLNGSKFMGRVPELGLDCQRNTAKDWKLFDLSVDNYKLSQYEVTQGLWEVVMGEPFINHINRIVKENPQLAKEHPYDYGIGEQLPVYYISQIDAQNFINRLNEVTGENFRLPTATEWINAERLTAGYYEDGSKRKSTKTVKKVNATSPNGCDICGLYDNVKEWTTSHPYGTAYNDKVILLQNCIRVKPESHQFNVGFRLAMD